MLLRADFDPIEVELPQGYEGGNSPEDWKEWLWEYHKDQILSSTTTAAITTPSGIITTQMKLLLLDTLGRVQRRFFEREEQKIVFGTLLEELLIVLNSEYGFIGETIHDEEGKFCLQTHAITNIAWDAATRQFYEDNKEFGLRFYNINSLFGHVLTSWKPVISNTPGQDHRAAGIPEGHPPLNAFLGIPFFDKVGRLNGMVGIANKPGGYSQADIEFLEPFSITCSNLIQAYIQQRENKMLITTLEEKVKERTFNLELANKRLEAANQEVLRASANQLKHFACMSHEIRTPLTCIIGMSSILAETKLSPMQEESVRMIVSSGNLLVTVVNDVLDYSKLESGNVDVEVRKSNLQDLLQGVVHSVEMKAQPKGIRLQTSYDCRLPEKLTTDDRRLQQILYNLLGNAIKFARENTTVELSVTLKDSFIGEDDMAQINPIAAFSEMDLTTTTTTTPASTSVESDRCPYSHHPDASSRCPFAHKSEACAKTDSGVAIPKEDVVQQVSGLAHDKKAVGKVICFAVKDYGIGIDKNDVHKIFEPFQQATIKTSRIHGGTGLGLAITGKLVKLLGGTISVESKLGEYSQFTVQLPFVDAPVDRAILSKSMAGITVIFINKDRKEREQVISLFDDYSVPCIMAETMMDISSKLVRNNPEMKQAFLCIVHEDMYQEESVKNVRSIFPKFAVVTFGPQFSVASADLHFRSLVQLLPVVFLKAIHTCAVSYQNNIPSPLVKRSPSIPMENDKTIHGNLVVLVADDNIVNQKVICRMLKQVGIQRIDVAKDGEEAVQLEIRTAYDMVFMDIQMPIMDGIEACKLIRERNFDRAWPFIIFVSAHASSACEKECMEAGASGFLAKPFNVREIEKCIRNISKLKTIHSQGNMATEYSLRYPTRVAIKCRQLLSEYSPTEELLKCGTM